MPFLIDKKEEKGYNQNEVHMDLKYDWDLKDVYKSIDDAYLDFEKYKGMKNELTTFKGKLSNREQILAFLNLLRDFEKLGERLTCYVYLRKSLNGKDEQGRRLESEIQAFDNLIAPKLAYINEELSKNSDKFLLSLAKEDQFKEYDLYLKDIVDGKKHIVKEEIEAVLQTNAAFGASEEAFDNFNDVDLKFEDVITKSGRKKLTHASYGRLISNRDQDVRKDAYDKTHKAFAAFNYTLGTLYLANVKEAIFSAKVEKFDSVLDMSCFNDKTNKDVLKTLIAVVHDNLNLFYGYERLKKQAMKLKNYYCFDNYYPLGKCNEKFEYPRATQIVLDALSVMGKEYCDVLKRAMSEGWIDVYEKPAKTSGGFCLSVYDVHPYVLLNHENNYSGLTTIAHELGHALHGFYTNKTQPILKAQPSIFACEVASIVNEIILINYLIDKAQNRQEKLFYISQLLHAFYTTVYRQTMFAEFEDMTIKKVEANEPILVENLNEQYEKLQALYFGKGAKKTKYSKYEWSRIPHFYRPYYVYKYSTGFVSACIIAKNIMAKKEGYLEKYMHFLKAGSSEDPLSLLKSVDVDLTKKETLQGCFELYKDLLGEFKKLL